MPDSKMTEGADLPRTAVAVSAGYITGGPSFARTAPVLADVAAERAAQDAKWGDQQHPHGVGDQEHALRPLYRIAGTLPNVGECTSGTLAYLAKQATDQAAREGHVTWAAILLEEVFEALASNSAHELRTELVQVAAVAVQWVEKIDAQTEDRQP